MNPRLAVVQIRSDKGQFLGTGFFTGSQRILTCHHVVKEHIDSDGTPRVIIHWLGEQRQATRCTAHTKRDAALLDCASSFSLTPFILRWAHFTAAEGRRVGVNGFSSPDTYELEHLVRFIRGYAPKYDLSVLDHPIQPGFSGSPAVVDEHVAGLIVATDPDRTLLIPVTALAEFRPQGDVKATDDCIVDVGTVLPPPDWGAPAELKFTVTNSASSFAKITSIAVRIQCREPLIEPHHFLPGAIVQEYELNVHLTPAQDTYELLDAPHVLQAGETDGFRIKFTSDDGWKYAFTIVITVRRLGDTEVRELSIGPFDFGFRLKSSQSLRAAIKAAREQRGGR
ncbi:MAG: trypsin-like peptidase domain-containing protein [Verrucomicrobia bacterium]|nr:trypsin-like peptidase domain-containing protein [Verrucomicrobiota bacterium]